jgi:c-di-GMP-binding flagellar brake protein YcgR
MVAHHVQDLMDSPAPKSGALRLSPFDEEPTIVHRRSQPRVSVVGTAAYLSNERIVIARSADVSLTGAFVTTHNPDPVGTRAALRLERNKEFIVAQVEVVRINFCSAPDGSGVGMGLVFKDLTRAQRRFLARYVAAQHMAG